MKNDIIKSVKGLIDSFAQFGDERPIKEIILSKSAYGLINREYKSNNIYNTSDSDVRSVFGVEVSDADNTYRKKHNERMQHLAEMAAKASTICVGCVARGDEINFLKKRLKSESKNAFKLICVWSFLSLITGVLVGYYWKC